MKRNQMINLTLMMKRTLNQMMMTWRRAVTSKKLTTLLNQIMNLLILNDLIPHHLKAHVTLTLRKTSKGSLGPEQGEKRGWNSMGLLTRFCKSFRVI